MDDKTLKRHVCRKLLFLGMRRRNLLLKKRGGWERLGSKHKKRMSEVIDKKGSTI
jgi:hypothetical protein